MIKNLSRKKGRAGPYWPHNCNRGGIKNDIPKPEASGGTQEIKGGTERSARTGARRSKSKLGNSQPDWFLTSSGKKIGNRSEACARCPGTVAVETLTSKPGWKARTYGRGSIAGGGGEEAGSQAINEK